MSHSGTVETRRRKHRAQKVRAAAAKLAKKQAKQQVKQQAKPAGAR